MHRRNYEQTFILGNINDNLNFEYGPGTTVSYGCAATLRGEFYYFGGADPNKRQVSFRQAKQCFRKANDFIVTLF